MIRKWATAPLDRHQPVLMGPSLDERIPEDAPIRLVDEILLGMDWTEWECAYSGAGRGRPPIHPRLMAAATLYGMMNRIRSSRDLETAASMRVDFHWLLGGLPVDHSTFAKFRKEHGDKLEGLLAEMNRQARAALSAGPGRLAIDGTTMRANSARTGARTARGLLDMVESLETEFRQVMADMETLDAMDGLDGDEIAALEKRKAELEREREKLEKALEVARERDRAKQEKDGKDARAVRVPLTDTDASVLPNKDGGHAPNYTATAAVDGDTGLIVHADVQDGGDEASAVQPAVEAAAATFGEKPAQLLADSHFATGANLQYLEGEGIEALAPSKAAAEDNPAARPDPTQPIDPAQIEDLLKRKGKLDKSFFAYDQEADLYRCPMGRSLPFSRSSGRGGVPGNRIVAREYQCEDCSSCPLASKCLSRKAKRRIVTRDAHEPLREALAARMRTDQAKEAYKSRAPLIETVFGHIKGAMGIRAFLTRGRDSVRAEWRWICAAYSMRKLVALLGRRRAAASPTDPSPTGTRSPALLLSRARPALPFRATPPRPLPLAA